MAPEKADLSNLPYLPSLEPLLMLEVRYCGNIFGAIHILRWVTGGH